MSTAATAIGCLAEDYTSELRQICNFYVVLKDQQMDMHGGLANMTEAEQRVYDVARSFVATADSADPALASAPKVTETLG